MRIKIIGLAFAIALLAMIGFAYFGTSGTAEATIDPIMSGECQSDAGEDAVAGHRPDFDGLVGPNNNQHPPGLSDPTKPNFIRSLLATGAVTDPGPPPVPDLDAPARNGQSGVLNGCPGA